MSQDVIHRDENTVAGLLLKMQVQSVILTLVSLLSDSLSQNKNTASVVRTADLTICSVLSITIEAKIGMTDPECTALKTIPL